MRELPLIFSPEMVDAIIDDRKSVSRRLKGLKEINQSPDEWGIYRNSWMNSDGDVAVMFVNKKDNSQKRFVKVPWLTGNILWVRESFWQAEAEDYGFYNGKRIVRKFIEEGGRPRISFQKNKPETFGSVWHYARKPSIFLPKTSARLWLEVAEIALARLHDMTQEDAKAEGVFTSPHRPSSEGCLKHADNSLKRDCYLCSFKFLWNRKHGKAGFGWDKNPWVWVISFKQIADKSIA
jgi:hypothetical protein